MRIGQAEKQNWLVLVQEPAKFSDLISKRFLLEFMAWVSNRIPDEERIGQSTLALLEQMAVDYLLYRRPDIVPCGMSAIQRAFQIFLPCNGI